MTTIVNTPTQSDNNGILGTVVIILLIAILAIVFFVYGLPLLRGAANSQTANPPTENKVDIKIPDQVDINVKQPEPSNP